MLMIILNMRFRCNNCNLQEYTVVKHQPTSDGLIPKLLRLRGRKYVHCIACGHIEDMDDYTRRLTTE